MKQSWQDCPAARAVNELFKASAQPAAVVNGDLLVQWVNDSALAHYSVLRTPDGILCLLDADTAQNTAAILSTGQVCTTGMQPLPFSHINMLFTPLPVQPDGSFFALVQFLGTYFERSEALDANAANRTDAAEADALGMDAVISAFSGQIRTPLTSIFASLGALSRSKGPTVPRELQGFLQTINQRSYQMLRHCVNLTEFMRYAGGKNPPEAESIDLTQFLSEWLQSVAVLTKNASIPLTWRLPEKSLCCLCEVHKLENALLNILSNSCRFTRPGNRIVVSLEETGTNARITIRDHGTGIAPQTLPHIFKPFFSYESRGGSPAGGGLGLTVAKMCIAAHGGSIAVQSHRQSTTVALTLPLTNPPDMPLLRAPPSMDILCDRFSPLYILLSDACSAPWP